MDYKNDNRTPRDRITGEFLSELLFTELGGDCDCNYADRTPGECSCERSRNTDRSGRSARADRSGRTDRTVRASAGVCPESYARSCVDRGSRESTTGNGNVEFTGNYSLAMAYVPMQEFGELFDIEEGFCEGTIFRGLRFPFYPTPCRKEGN